MTTLEAPARPRQAIDPPLASRSLRSRLSLGHIVMLLAALLAGLLNYSLLRSRDTRVRVAVVADGLEAGAPLSSDGIRFVSLDADQAVLATLLQPAAVSGVEGWVATTTLASGELVRTSDLREPSAPGERRAMSIPVEPTHAVGGAIRAGDRVDVIAVRGGAASYVLTDAPVLATSGQSDRGALGGLAEFSVTLAVDDRSALRLAAAVHGDALEVVRSTGADPATSSSYDPLADTGDGG